MSFDTSRLYNAVYAMVAEQAKGDMLGFLRTARCDAGVLPELIYNGDVQAFYDTHREGIANLLNEIYDGSKGDLNEALWAMLDNDFSGVVYTAVDWVMGEIAANIESETNGK